MANKLFVYPYKAGSKSAIALAQGLEAKLIKLQNSKFNPTGKIIVNWGSATMPEDYIEKAQLIINNPKILSRASNKLTFFKHLAAINKAVAPRYPDFTTDKEVALGWVKEGSICFARTILNGHSGAGIVILEKEEDFSKINNGTLIVKYVMKRHEFRIHISRDKGVICSQQKKRNKEVPDDKVDYRIRNHSNGFIFAKQDLDIPEDVIVQAKKTIEALELDFGAIDIIYNERKNEAYVVEVNSAPGLEGTTVNDYIEFIKSKVK